MQTPPFRPASPHRHPDLLNPDGTVSRAAVMRLAHRKARYERDLSLCTANGVLAPLVIPLGDVAAWRAARAKTVPPESASPYGAYFSAGLAHSWEDARAVARGRRVATIAVARKTLPALASTGFRTSAPRPHPGRRDAIERILAMTLRIVSRNDPATPARPEPRRLYADLITELMVLCPPRCLHYMDDSDFAAMDEHLRELTGHLQSYVSAIGAICAENSHAIDPAAFTETFSDALADVSHSLNRAAEGWRAEHAASTTPHCP